MILIVLVAAATGPMFDPGPSWLLFQTIHTTTTLKATNGRRKPAIDVFAYALGFMKDHMKQAIECTFGKYVCVADLSIAGFVKIYLWSESNS